MRHKLSISIILASMMALTFAGAYAQQSRVVATAAPTGVPVCTSNVFCRRCAGDPHSPKR